MQKYCVDVVAPLVEGPADNLNKLIFALDALAALHGGKVLELTDGLATVLYHRQCVNLIDCEDSLGKELDWLQKEFPQVQFGLAQMMATG